MTRETLIPARVRQLIIAGWTGRDRIGQEGHIAELERLGVRRPASTPAYYRVSPSRLTTCGSIQVSGGDSSGEVEFVMLMSGGSLWIGAGSDHTDRKVETYNITVSKQMCDKPVADELWLFDDISDHWDCLVLRSWAIRDGDRCLYQEGGVAVILHPRDLIKAYLNQGGSFDEGSAMFGGTLGAIGGIRAADRFEFALEDPVRNLRLTHGHDIQSLPVPE